MYNSSGVLILEPTMKVGDLVITRDRVWRVGLVNFTRARLDPITPDPSKDRSDWSSIDVGPTSLVESGEDYEFDEADSDRLIKLLEDAELEALFEEERRLVEDNKRLERAERDRIAAFINTPASMIDFEDYEEEHIMAGANAVEAPVPDSKPTVAKTLQQKNKERIEALRAKKAEAKAAQASNLQPKRERKPKAEKVVKPCACGCDGETTATFVPGHDARFKGWLIAIEKGDVSREDSAMPAEVQAAFKWVPSGLEGKAGKGYRPTTNYKGEPHEGYVDAAQRERIAERKAAAAERVSEARAAAAPAPAKGAAKAPAAKQTVQEKIAAAKAAKK